MLEILRMKNNMRRILSFLFLILLAASAQAQSSTPTGDEANSLFTAQKWEAAAQAYTAITKIDAQNARAWYRLGYSLHAMGKYELAVQAFQRAVDIGNNPTAMYNLACAYARSGNKDKAFEWLNKSLNAGVPQPAQISTDNDFASLRDDARFKEITTLAARIARPCQSYPEYKQFDFWVGDWNVQTQQGQMVGTNTVQRIEDGCILLENWTGLQGGTGKSINFYNVGTGKWRQTWVDSTGNVAEFQGQYKDGALRYEGEGYPRGGQKVLSRLTFFNLGPDRVRQFAEQSTDGGKTWNVSYDFIYLRKNAGAKEGR
jgi:tetratricopeptide (TPR) repeat protein